MPDTVIRDELLESDRWLGLPADTDRLAFIGFRLKADSFGNLEAGDRRIYRLLNGFTQVKSEQAALAVLQHLVDADLVRLYRVDGRDFLHLPRSRPTGSYLVRRCPPSPWCTNESKLGKHVRAIRNQGLAKNLPVTLQERNGDVSQGIGIGIGIGKKQRGARAPFVLPDWIPKPQWEAWLEARAKARKPATEFAKQLAVNRLAILKEQGHHPAAVLAECALNNWAGIWPLKGNKNG